MLKSIYTPLSGALAQEKVLDIIANNLANVNTVGFKAESVSFKLIEPEPDKNYVEPLPPANYKMITEEMFPLAGNEMSYVGVSGVQRDYAQGSPIQTRNPLDLMIEGDGFLTVNTKEGARYTRDGALSLNEDGALIDSFGNPVLGEKGNIFLHGNKFQINTLGEVYQDKQLVDRLKIVDFSERSQLEKVGKNQYFYSGPEASSFDVKFPAVRQGYLESSNVNAIKNLTNMIVAHRSYEAYQQAIKNYDSMMDKSSNQIGALRG